MNWPTLYVARYALTFIDDFSKYTWLYFLKNKDRVFDKFKEIRLLVEKKHGQPMKCLIFDNGGEFVSKDFEIYLSQHGMP